MRHFRGALASEISTVYGETYYQRLLVRTLEIGLPSSVPNLLVATLLLSDALMRNVPDHSLAPILEKFDSLEIPQTASTFIGFILAGKKRYLEAVEWLSKGDLNNPEVVSLFLRIVAEVPESRDIVSIGLASGLPVASPNFSAGAALRRVKSVSKNLPRALSFEMHGDAESAF